MKSSLGLHRHAGKAPANDQPCMSIKHCLGRITFKLSLVAPPFDGVRAAVVDLHIIPFLKCLVEDKTW